MLTLNQLIVAAENAVAIAGENYETELRREADAKSEAAGKMCEHCGSKHSFPMGGDYWHSRWLAFQRLEAAQLVLDVLLAERALLPSMPPDLPLKQGYEWRERYEVRKGELPGSKERVSIGELIPTEQA